MEVINGEVVGIGKFNGSTLRLNSPVSKNAFIGCDCIGTVIFDEGVTSMGEHAFACCENLRKVIFLSAQYPKIDADIFAYTWNKDEFIVYVPKGSIEKYKSIADSYWKQFVVDVGKIKEL